MVAIKITFLAIGTTQILFLCLNIVILVLDLVEVLYKFCCFLLIPACPFCASFVIVNLLQAGRSHAATAQFSPYTVMI